jgi:hypothetical protein
MTLRSRRCRNSASDELPRSKLRGIEQTVTIMFSKGVTPECFYRGSSQCFAWIPAKSMRE